MLQRVHRVMSGARRNAAAEAGSVESGACKPQTLSRTDLHNHVQQTPLKPSCRDDGAAAWTPERRSCRQRRQAARAGARRWADAVARLDAALARAVALAGAAAAARARERASARDSRTPWPRPPALAIGCGRQAALATRLLRERGARAVQILDPRIDHASLGPGHRARARRPARRQRHHPARQPASGRRPVAGAARAGVCRASPHLPGRAPRCCWAAPARMRGSTMRCSTRLLARLESLAAHGGGSLLATASRRTPASVRAPLRERFGMRCPG